VNNKTGKSGLHRYDGTTGKVSLVADFTDSSMTFQWIVPTENFVYFATQNNNNGALCSLWRTDGTSKGTLMLENNVREFFYRNYHSGTVPVAIDSILYFMQATATGDAELWRTDGSLEGTQRIAYVDYSFSGNYCQLNDSLYYTSNGYLYKTGGAPNSAVIVKKGIQDIENLLVSNNRLYFTASASDTAVNKGIKGNELWVTDGSAEGTRPVKDIAAGNAGSNPQNLIDVNGWLYFLADDGIHGNELWKTNGTDSGTVMVKDITPGQDGTKVNSYSNNDALFINVNGRLMMAVNRTLWESDGTEEGTKPAEGAIFQDMTYVHFLVTTGDKLFFRGQSYRYGLEAFAGTIAPVLNPRYVFNGSGNFTDPSNWLNGAKSPSDIPPGVEVIISPPAGKPCIINEPVHINGGKLTIDKNAKIIVQGGVVIK